jgi:HD-GYP domain-containing protein (c-di-GMP phosphodiesterase class II)
MMHSISVGAYILNFCNSNKISRDQTMALAIGALFHDIGKTRIPLAILNKPGKLSDDEFTEMKKHSLYSAEVLRNAKGLPEEAYDMGLHHHERYDGTGYPHGLKGDEICFGSQLCAIADVYDALTSDRCYKNGIDRVEALRKLYEWSEYHFNKELTYKFIRGIGVYPIGTCVKLESGRIGVVVGSTESSEKPVVRIFYDEKKKAELPVHDLDLFYTEDRVAMYEDAGKWDLKKMSIFKDVSADLFPI